MTDSYERIFRDPEFLRMAKARDRFARRLLAATLAIFLALLILVAFFPAVLAIPLGPGRVTTLAWPLGAATIVVPWIFTLIYVRKVNATGPAMDAVVRRALA